LARKHEINPEYRTPTRNHIKFPEDPTALRKPLNCVNGMNKKAVKIRRLDELPSNKPLNCVNGMNKKTVKIQRLEELPSVPLSNVKRSSCTVRSSSLRNLMNKRRKVTVSEEKPVAMTKLPEIDRDTEMRQVYIPVFTATCFLLSNQFVLHMHFFCYEIKF
jgi:hypothetical protein